MDNQIKQGTIVKVQWKDSKWVDSYVALCQPSPRTQEFKAFSLTGHRFGEKRTIVPEVIVSVGPNIRDLVKECY